MQLAAFDLCERMERLLLDSGASTPDDFYGLKTLFAIET